jgi:hypothetical protein
MEKITFRAYLFIALILSLNGFGQTAVSTFNCIGYYWSGQSGTCKVQYRKQGDTNWLNGLDASFDNRAIGGRPANEFRGSIVNLQPGTTYEIQLTAGTSIANIVSTTWSETFPVGSTTNLTSSTTLSTNGTANAYRIYTGSISGGGNNLVINASYIIIRGMTLSGATNDAIVLGQNAHDVIIENCDISGWGQSASTLGGNNQAAVRVQGFSYNAKGIQRIVIQRNKIHDPRYSASGWSTETAGDHPYGVNGINFENAGGNHVIRFNDIIGSSDASKRFMDGIGGADNFTTEGFPNNNSDIYGNNIIGCFDDGIESEGGNCNVRIWGNFLNYTFTGIATATNSVGPMYVFNNLTNVGMRMSYVNSTEDRGPFNKCGSGDASVRGGRTYLFHNTILQPSGNRGLCGGIVDNGGAVTNVISKNNIWTSAYTSKGGLPIAMWQGGGQNCNSDHDLLSPNSTTGTFAKTGTLTGTPTYSSSIPLTLDPNGYFLTGPGKGQGIPINNFNDGINVDVGAYQTGEPALQFGVNAGGVIVTPPPVANLAPSANAGLDQTIQFPVNSVTLAGSGSDPDGSIVSYSWSEGSTILTNAQNFTATYSTAGVHTYRLTVTDNLGATAFDDVKVTVLAANPPPVVKTLVRVEITQKAVYSDSTSQTTITIIK